MSLWPAVMLRSFWVDAHACDGHPCGLYQDVVRKSPLKPRGHINLGIAYQKKNKPEKALNEYRTAVQLSFQPGWSDSERQNAQLWGISNAGNLLERLGRTEEAYQVFADGWNLVPGFPAFALALGGYHLNHGHAERAEQFLTEGISHLKEFPGFTDGSALYVNRAGAYALMGRDSERRADCQMVRDPDIDLSKVLQCQN